MLDDVGGFSHGACNLSGGCPGSQSQSVVGQLNAVDSSEAPPEQIFFAVVFDIEGVDTVLHTDFVADEKFAMVSKRPCR